MYMVMNSPTRLAASYLSRPVVRTAVLSAAAAAVGYGIGSVLTPVSPVVAAVTALIAVRPTFHASVQEAMRQVLGVIIGAVVAFAALKFIGFSVVALFAALLACFVVAGWLKIGEEGAVAVGVTVILVVGPHFNTEAIETRLFGVLAGSLVALVVSFFARPGAPHERALAEIVLQAEASSRLLTTIAGSLAAQDKPVAEPMARQWLDQARTILRTTVEIRLDAQDAVDGSQWSPMIDPAEAVAVLNQVRMTESAAVTVVSLCQDLVALAHLGHPLPASVRSSLSVVLSATANAMAQQSETALHHPAQALDDDTGPVRVVQTTRREAVSEVRNLDDTGSLLLGGAMLRDLERISRTLSGK